MREPAVRIRLDETGRTYQPGDTLSGEFQLESIVADEIKAIEVSILWQTDGKGDEDLAVHDFRRFSPDEDDPSGPRRSQRFSTTLPNSPLSYDGVIIKLQWYVRVRVFLSGDRQVSGELPFRLGQVPPVEVTVS